MKNDCTTTVRHDDGLSGMRMSEVKDLKSRKALKVRLERLLSEALSDQFDCDITIKFKPEPEELEAMQVNSGNE